MKLIPLTQGKFAMVDDADFEWLNQWKWSAQKMGNTFYAKRCIYPNGKKYPKTILMHRIILGLTNPKELGDHINKNGLDNQRGNLRKSTKTQNQINSRSRIGSTSKYLGVHWNSSHKRWRAVITVNKKSIHLGQFKNEDDAGRCYNKAAEIYHGEFANLNIIS